MPYRAAMENKTPGMKSLINNVAISMFGMSVSDAVDKGVCVQCHQVAMSNIFTEAGEKEYYTSGLCERCFDNITGGGEE